jgi:hypothetical protein
MAMAGNGTAVILWQVDRFADERPDDGRYARVRYPNGVLGPVHRLNGETADNAARAVFFGPSDGQPRVASGVFAESAGDPRGLFLDTLDANAGSVAQNKLYSEVPFDLAIDVDANGNALIVWSDYADRFSGFREVVGTVLRSDGTVGPLIAISRPGIAASLLRVTASLSPGGTGHVTWAEGDSGRRMEIMSRQVSTGGGMGPPIPVANIPGKSATPRPIDTAAFADGQSLVVWAEGLYGPVRGRFVGPATAGSVVRISGTRKQEIQANFPRVVAHGQKATVVWTYGRPMRETPRGKRYGETIKYGVRSRSVSTSGRLGRTLEVLRALGGQFTGFPNLAQDAEGRTVAAWLTQFFDIPGKKARRRGKYVLLSSLR